MNRINKIIRSKKGTIYIEILITFIVVTVIILTSINLFNIVMKYQDITYMSKSLARTIEIEGAVSNEVYDKLDALNENFSTNATMTISDVTYFNSMDKSIQFRDPFTITIEGTYEFQILSPLFADPVVIDIPMKSNITGMSEVYWKE